MPFNIAPALECLLLNISSTVCFPIRTALLRLVPGSTFPAALQRECQLRSSAFPNQTDNLSLRCFSRKSKNHCILFPVRLVPSLIHGGRWSLVCLQIGRGHPGQTWCWSQLFNFSSDARIIWITSRCQYLFFVHATPNPSSFIFKECPRTIVLAVVRAMHHMHQWYLATSRQKAKGWICTTSIPSWTHWFLSFVRVSLRVVTSLSNPGVWDLTHWSQEARWGAARRAGPGQTVWDLPRSSEFVPPGTVELLIQHGRKLKVCTATMQPNARQVLLPGDRSLIEACLACELHLKVVWHGWTAWAEWKCPFSCQIYKSTRLQDDATSWPSFAWSHCEIDICQLMILQFKVWPGWPSSGWQVVYKWCFSFGICIGQFPWHFFRQGPASTRGGAIPVLEIKPSDGRWWQTDEKDETDNWHQVTSLATSLASPQATLTSARWTRVISCA